MRGEDVARARAGSGMRSTLADDALLLGRLAVIGGLLGALTVGVVGRLEMFVLAHLNPSMHGIDTDDGFPMGRFTLSGSVNLLTAGMAFGVLSGVLYLALRPLQVGPGWFRTLSISVGAGVVAGSMLVHRDGVDFTHLQPIWLAVAMFATLPVLHVALLDLLGTRVVAGRLLADRRWGILGVVVSLPLAPLVAVIVAVRVLVLVGRRRPRLSGLVGSPTWARLGRLGLSAVFVLAVGDLAGDVDALL